MWQQIWICSSSKCKFACSTHQAPQRRGTKLPHTMLVIRQKLPKQSKTIARAVVKLAVRNEIFCPFAQLRIPATYFTLKQLIKGWRPSGLLIFGFLRERRGKGLCSEQSRQAFQQCWSVPVAGRAPKYLGCWYIRQMDPPPYYSTTTHFELELTQPLQTVAIWQRLVVARGSFSSSSGSGPGGSGWRHAARNKHWVQLLFDM